MQDAYLGLGSNLGDRRQHLADAVAALGKLPGTRLVGASLIYETPPMGPQDQGAYLNMAAHLETDLSVLELMSACQRIERSLGRPPADQRRHWGPRPIDLDLLLVGGLVVDTPELTLPHPGLHERWFVLRPLADLAPDAVHPVLKETVSALLAKLEETDVEQGVLA